MVTPTRWRTFTATWTWQSSTDVISRDREIWLRFVAKPAVFIACLVPFALLLKGAVDGDLGANPLEHVTHATGDWALRLLLVTLAMTPLRRLSGNTAWLRFRRMFGLFAFFYASVHLLIWVWLDRELAWGNMLADIAKRPYITVGFAAWLLLVPLAATSTRAAMRRLGRNWKKLHRAVYAIAILGVLHFVWLVKADLFEPLIYATVLALLLALRWRPALQQRQALPGRSIKAR
ncbi:MAG: sulfoxide reductase heme-binding subunit YedZ [Gammaproteobacteria bacterium]|nr:sulfoxide reductase heme-binding subunit YedZ [Gammaproteobacteria bacterium]MCB1924232.1 sulfoxide reductase heme-binding subunit YedZ [Gammaproteobacteria bacterium]